MQNNTIKYSLFGLCVVILERWSKKCCRLTTKKEANKVGPEEKYMTPGTLLLGAAISYFAPQNKNILLALLLSEYGLYSYLNSGIPKKKRVYLNKLTETFVENNDIRKFILAGMLAFSFYDKYRYPGG